nr:hypothetical protein [Tanacetum cinerariifolium]
MRTRSQSRHNSPQQETTPAIVEPLRIELLFLEDQFQEDPPEVSMADNRTTAELLQAPTEGYEDAIVIPEIAANNFELKHETRSGNTTHADNSLPEYDSFCFEIKPEQERLINLMKNDISDLSNNSLLEEVDLFLSDDLIPLGIENIADDPEGDIRFLKELLIDDSILSHELSDSNFEDNPSIPRPPPKPPDAEMDAGEEILVVMIVKDKFDDDYQFFMFDKVFALLSAESEDTIFDPGIFE